MSRNLRPVKTIWGEASSVFIDTENFPELVTDIFPKAKVSTDDQNREALVVRIEQGLDFLNILNKMTGKQAAKLVKKHQKRGRAAPGWNGLRFLIDNMRCMANPTAKDFSAGTPVWRNALDGDGSLTFWVD